MVEEITSTSVCEITDGESDGDLTTADYLEALLRRNKIPRTREKKEKLGDFNMSGTLVQLPLQKVRPGEEKKQIVSKPVNPEKQ